MVPAMTAREKIARAAAALVIEKAVPAVVPLGAGKATSAAGGQADPGWDPAGIRDAAVGGVADVTTGAPATGAMASGAPATDARRDSGIGAAVAGRIVTTAVAAR